MVFLFILSVIVGFIIGRYAFKCDCPEVDVIVDGTDVVVETPAD